MVANLMSPDTFIERANRETGPAWHGLGEVYAEDLKMTATDAVTRIHGDFEVVKCENKIILPDGAMIATGDYSLMRQPTRVDDQWRSLGSCSNDFNPVQNMDLARLLDKGLTEVWPVETAGLLGKMGERLFVVLAAGEFDVLGQANQNVKMYYMATSGKKPGDGINFVISSVRTVCQNTLDLALGAAAINIQLRQTGDVLGRMELVNDMVLELQQSQSAARQQIERLAMQKVVKKQVDAILAATFPEPKKGGTLKLWEAAGSDDAKGKALDGYINRQARDHVALIDRCKRYRVSGVEMYDKICTMEPEIAGTAWAVVNAVTELADWSPMGRADASAAESVMFGERSGWKVRALKSALALCKG